MGDIMIILIIILVVVLVWRGPKTLPKLGQALGRGVREARDEATAAGDEISRRVDDDSPTDAANKP